MSKLPGTDLPAAGETQAPAGVDPARVEQAFAVFADRVRELEEVAAELRAELHALRAERGAPRIVDAEQWPVELVEGAASPDWVAAVPAPLARGNPIPRLALEGVFLLLVALFAGLADLSVEWIVLVMTAAWALVVLGEWAAAAKRAAWRLDEVAPPLGDPAAETTGPWDMPVVEATVVESGPEPESQTVVTKLPAEPAEEDPEQEPEAAPETPAPMRRRGLRRRKQPAEAGAADPWEA
jgi:hypothetical protein